jgi:hypothetical protein
MTLLVISDYWNEPYIIRYIASMNDFERYLPDFELMVKSFMFGTNATRSE